MGIALIVVGMILAVIGQATIWGAVFTLIVGPALNDPPSQNAKEGLAIFFGIAVLVGTIANLVIGIGAARVGHDSVREHLPGQG
jgi:hypothetical protein